MALADREPRESPGLRLASDGIGVTDTPEA